MPTPYDPRNDLYSLLGVIPSSTPAQIRRAYRSAMKRAHPDVCEDPGAAARAQALNEAKRVLLDSDLRREYDAARQRWVADAWQNLRRYANRNSAAPDNIRVVPAANRVTTPDAFELLARVLGVDSPGGIWFARFVGHLADTPTARARRR